MNTNIYGGNLVKHCELGNPGKQVLGSGPYEYYIYETHVDEQVTFDELLSFTVYFLEKPASAKVSVQGVDAQIMQGDSIQAENIPIYLLMGMWSSY